MKVKYVFVRQYDHASLPEKVVVCVKEGESGTYPYDEYSRAKKALVRRVGEAGATFYAGGEKE